LNILLAEDNKVNQLLATKLLGKQGHHIQIAQNGREAFELYQRQSFDLILMDVPMPEMDGFEATAAIREWKAKTARRMPILALTAHAMAGDREICLERGMDGYVTKPIQPDRLQEEILALAR
jgi:CheY-like chemotaxis protein